MVVRENIEGITDKLGGEFTYRYKDIHYSKHKITEFIPGKKVVWLVLDSSLNFIEDKTEWNGTQIIFDIASKGGKTEVRFSHVGLVPEVECYDGCSNAWGSYINGSLRNLITEGQRAAQPERIATRRTCSAVFVVAESKTRTKQTNITGGEMTDDRRNIDRQHLTLTINQEMRVRAPLDTTFTALLEQMGPHNETPEGNPLPMKIEPGPAAGGTATSATITAISGESVQAIKRPTLLEIHGPLVHVLCGGFQSAVSPLRSERRARSSLSATSSSDSFPTN